MAAVQASTPEGVVAAVVGLVVRRQARTPGRVRVAVDGAEAADPHTWAAAVVEGLAPGRAVQVRADRFWRPASLRLEWGREDEESWLDGWLDEAALVREVLEPAASGGSVLPELRDPATDRSVRAARVDLPADGVVVVSGGVLLGRGLPFDLAVHLAMTPAALARRTPAGRAWTLPALARYAAERDPEGAADLVVRVDDPRHPALVRRPDGNS
ncbi:MAG: hypothetical protein U0S36_03680 [Candidatus Nanopelagicales bacterium]